MKYDTILNLPHWNPIFHLRMPLKNRAAQFSPFDPLNGYEEAVSETARPTETERYLDEESVSSINRSLAYLKLRLKENPPVTMTYYEPDFLKTGGAYRTRTETIKKIDEYEGLLILMDGSKIPLEHIFSLIVGEKE